MANGSLLSPSVTIRESDMSQVVAFEGTSVTVFGGNFTKGPIGFYQVVDSVENLRDLYGDPTKTNINEWMQCYNFLQYSNTLLVSRAANLDGDMKLLENVSYESDTFFLQDIKTKLNLKVYKQNGVDISFEKTDLFKVNDRISVMELPQTFKIKYLRDEQIDVMERDPNDPTNVVLQTVKKDVTTVTFDAIPELHDGDYIYKITEAVQPKGNKISLRGQVNLKPGEIIGFSDSNIDPLFRVLTSEIALINGQYFTNISYIGRDDDSQIVSATTGGKVYKLERTQSACAEVSVDGSEVDVNLLDTVEHTVPNYTTFDELQKSLPFVSETSKLKIFAKTPGAWGNLLEVAIANPEDFNKGKEAKDGISLDSLYEYIPDVGTFGLMVFYKNQLVETFTVSFNEKAKDDMNNSLYIENVINKKSNYILVNVNEANLETKVASRLEDNIINLYKGSDSEAGKDDIIDAYNVFENNEEVEIDIVMANELYQQAAAELVLKRLDCVAYISAPKEICVGLKATEATRKHLEWRKELNYNSSYIAIFSNYKYQYSPDLDKNVWINLCGDICGITAKVNFENGSHWASAGLNRGIIKNVVKLANSFSLTNRDELYKNQINPIVTFPNQGSVVWGNKTSQTKASSFDRVNTRRLFNEMERALAKMSKYQLFEFNDAFTRNYISSIIKPYLAGKKAARALTDFLVIVDETNNTPSVVANNQLIIDIYIKPVYVAEWIILHFVNVGTNDFSIAISKA